jgi:hypothetical protein
MQKNVLQCLKFACRHGALSGVTDREVFVCTDVLSVLSDVTGGGRRKGCSPEQQVKSRARSEGTQSHPPKHVVKRRQRVTRSGFVHVYVHACCM